MVVEMVRKEKIVNVILVGDIEKIKEIVKSIDMDIENYELIDIKDLVEVFLKFVELVL